MINKATLHIIVFTILSLSVYQVSGQSDYEKLLIKSVEESVEAEAKIKEYLNLIQYYQEVNIQKAVETGAEALEIAKGSSLSNAVIELEIVNKRSDLIKNGFEDKLGEIVELESSVYEYNTIVLRGDYYLLLSFYYSHYENMSESFEYSLKAVRVYKEYGDSERLAKAYKEIASNYYLFGDHGKSMEYYKLCEKQLKKSKNYVLKSKVYSELGNVYSGFEEYEKALEYYKKAYSLYKKYGLTNYYSDILSSIAGVHYKQKNILDAINVNQVAIGYAIDEGDLKHQAEIYNNIGSIYLLMNRLDSSKLYLYKSLTASESYNNKHALAKVNYSLSRLYFKRSDYEKAVIHMTNSYHYAESAGDMDLSQEAVDYLARIEASRGNYRLAYDYKQISSDIGDSIKLSSVSPLCSKESQDVRRKLYLYESELEKDDLVMMYEQEERRFFITILLFSIFTILLIALISYWRLKLSKKNAQKLQQKAKEVDDHRALLEISNVEIMEQYAFIETLLNTIPNPVFYTDKRNRLLGCNHAFEVICNASSDDLAGVNMKNISTYSDIELIGDNIFEKNELGLYRSEGVLKFHDGEDHYVMCYRKGIIDKEGVFIGSVGILNDVSELKFAQNKLIKSEEKLKEALEAKNKFFNIVAHDLKNPFNAVLGLSMLLVDNYESYSDSDVVECLENINNSATQVYNLLENLLDWARAQSGAIEVRPVVFSVNEPIRESIDLLRFLIEKKKIKVKFDYGADFMIKADKDMALVIVRNILSNAIKYTPEKGEVHVSIVKDADNIKLTIKDTGVGIGEERLGMLLNIDRPISTPGANNEKGTGLGLIITREFLKLNNGSITINSEEGKGSEFTLSLPAAL